MPTLDLYLDDIKDSTIRTALYRVLEWARLQDLLIGDFRFYTLNLIGTLTNFKFAHNLGFIPKDILVTSIIANDSGGGGTVQFNYSKFDAVNLDISTTDSCTVRFFAGNFVQGSQA